MISSTVSDIRCLVSIGISHNVLCAKLATRKAKPAGSFHLMKEDTEAFVAELDVKSLPGVAYATRQKVRLPFPFASS